MAAWKPSIEAVNYHIWRTCNMKCKFCFATYDSVLPQHVKRGIPLLEAQRLIAVLRDAGFRKITFAGGEPTLCPWLPEVVAYAKDVGFKTAIVSNGSRLTRELIDLLAPSLDWITLSIDSGWSGTNAMTGRAVAGRWAIAVTSLYGIVDEFRAQHVRLKVNTVVTRHNCEESLVDLIARVRPERWKVMRVLRIVGENDRDFDYLGISDDEFQSFLDINSKVPAGTTRVVEDNPDMIASYVMVDPVGRFIDNSEGRYRASEPILEVGVEVAFRQVTHHRDTFERRGGDYDW
jgi:radical S-adenosyl methionine domain-containing protein 2